MYPVADKERSATLLSTVGGCQLQSAKHVSAAQEVVVIDVETGPNPPSERLNTDTVRGPLRPRSGSRPGSSGTPQAT